MIKLIKENPWKVGIVVLIIISYFFEWKPLGYSYFFFVVIITLGFLWEFFTELYKIVLEFIRALITGSLTREDYKAISITLFITLLLIIYLK